jgi:glycosyltransferase involved in cell wall biosynthesis
MRDSSAIVEKLTALADNPTLLTAMSASARERSAGYTVEKYGERLIAAFREHHII